MFQTGPPGLPEGGGVRISRAERRVFGESSELATDPSLRPYLTDMVGAYGLALRDPVFEAAAGHSYGEMAEPLIEAMVDADTPVDLLVLAHGIHDVRLGRSTATYLSSRCPGNPLAFAVCDQGVAAPFSALRAVHAYAVTGGCRRALLLVAEQSALHYEPAGPARVPDRHAAVAFLLEPAAGAAPLDVRQRAVDPGRVREVLAAELAELLPGGGPGATVILGSDLADVADLANLAGLTGLPAIAAADEVVVAPAGQPCTGVWWELAARLPVGDEHGRQVVVAEYDPVLGYLCTTTSPGAGAVPGPAPVGARGAA